MSGACSCADTALHIQLRAPPASRGSFYRSSSGLPSHLLGRKLSAPARPDYSSFSPPTSAQICDLTAIWMCARTSNPKKPFRHTGARPVTLTTPVPASQLPPERGGRLGLGLPWHHRLRNTSSARKQGKRDYFRPQPTEEMHTDTQQKCVGGLSDVWPCAVRQRIPIALQGC